MSLDAGINRTIKPPAVGEHRPLSYVHSTSFLVIIIKDSVATLYLLYFYCDFRAYSFYVAKLINVSYKAVCYYASRCLTRSELTTSLDCVERPHGVTDSHHLGFWVYVMIAPTMMEPTQRGISQNVSPLFSECTSVSKAHYPPLRRVVRKIKMPYYTWKYCRKLKAFWKEYIFKYTIDAHKSLV